MTRAEKVAEAQRLRAEGLKLMEICERMGAPRSTVHTWLSDPDLSKQRARRARYAGTCIDCGKPTDGSSGFKAPKQCQSCLNRELHRQAVKRTISAIQRFNERYDRPPTAPDFNPAFARGRGHGWRAERFYRDGDYPVVSSVIKVFGSWNAALSAAGFNTQRAGTFARTHDGTHRGAHLVADRAAACPLTSRRWSTSCARSTAGLKFRTSGLAPQA